MNMNSAVIQYAPGTDKEANLETIRRYVAQASEQGAAVAVLPEYAVYAKQGFDPSYAETAEPLEGPTVQKLRQFSHEYNIGLIVGVHEPAENDRIYNTLVAIQDGQVAATYRKLHLFDAFGMQESQWVEPGRIEVPQLVNFGGFQFGLQTCYDLRFPEVSRMLVDAGAEVLVIPAAWVPGPLKESHWMTLLRARAIENTVYVLGADQTGPISSGHSTIVDPMGVPLAMRGDDEGIAQARLSKERLESTRNINPALTLRRFTTSPKQS